MKVGIIGAGRVGCALALGLKLRGCGVTGVYSRNPATIEFLKDKLDSGVAFEFEKVVRESEIIFITVPDSHIESTAERIANNIDEVYLKGKTFFHCSGALTSEILLPLQQKGGNTASFHPVQTFADIENGWKGLENIYFGFEGTAEAQDIASGIVGLLNSKLLIMTKGGKSLYHAAACVVSNYTVALSHLANELLREAGVEGDSCKIFSPLLRNTVNNMEQYGPAHALTGPVARGDTGVVEKHLAAMELLDLKYIKAYKAVGKIAVDLALIKGTIDKDTAAGLYGLLED